PIQPENSRGRNAHLMGPSGSTSSPLKFWKAAIMRTDVRQRLLAIAGGGLAAESGVTGVAHREVASVIHPVNSSATPAGRKIQQVNQYVTPVTPCHTLKSEGYKKADLNVGIGGLPASVTLSVTAA